MKFNAKRIDYTGIDGKRRIAFVDAENESPASFAIEASPMGIILRGALKEPLSSQADLESFYQVFCQAWDEHEKLAPKLVLTPSGH